MVPHLLSQAALISLTFQYRVYSYLAWSMRQQMTQAFNHLLFVDMNLNYLFTTVVHKSIIVGNLLSETTMCPQTFIVNQWKSNMRIMRFLCKIDPCKSWWEIRQEGGRGRQSEKDLGREREQHSGERKWRGLILTVGLNQQHLLTLNTWEFINSNNRQIICQSNFWVVFCIP